LNVRASNGESKISDKHRNDHTTTAVVNVFFTRTDRKYSDNFGNLQHVTGKKTLLVI